MTDLEENAPEEEQGKKKKGDGDGEEGAGAARGEVSVSPAFFEYMTSIGAPKELIAEVLRTWRHLKGEGLMRRMMDFAKGLIRSNHVQVEFGQNKDYAIMHNFVQSTKETAALAQNLQTQQNQHNQQKQHSQAHGMDMNLTLRPK